MTDKLRDGNFDKTQPVGVEEYDAKIRLFCGGYEEIFKISFMQGYVSDLNESKEFDGATCILVMHFLKDDGAKLGLLKSIHQRLKSGAPLVLVDGCGDPASKEFEKTIQAWKQYPVMHGVDPGQVEKAFSEIITKMVRFVPEPRILELLNQAGFVNVFKYYTGFLYSGWTACKG